MGYSAGTVNLDVRSQISPIYHAVIFLSFFFFKIFLLVLMSDSSNLFDID